MKKKIISLVLALVLCLGLAVPAFSMTINSADADASTEEERPAVETGCCSLIRELYGTVQSDEIELIGENVSANNFGGLYRDDDGNLVVNVVDLERTAEVNANLDSTAADKVKFEKVKYSLSFLEKAADMLVPYMSKYGIITLDADDKTNQLVICITNTSEDNVAELLAAIEAVSIPSDCVKIIDCSGVSVQDTVKKIDGEIFADTSAINLSKVGFGGLMPGGLITAGNYAYTLGPYRAFRFYTAGHKFPLWTNITYRFGNDFTTQEIGYSTNSRFSGSTDIAVITPKSGYGQADIFSYDFADPVVGDKVAMTGAFSGGTGKITGLNVRVYYKELDTVLTLARGDYPCISGDSGAPIFNSFTSVETITTCYGVQSGGTFDENGAWAGSSFFTTTQNMLF